MKDLQIFHIEHWQNFPLAFIPLFVAIDVLGILPIFMSLVEGVEKPQKARFINQSVITALSVSIGFLAVGKFVFSILGIEIYDFKMAGGLLLLVFAINDLLFSEKSKKTITSTMGVVPLGIPLVVGPAVLTTIIVTVDTYGYIPTITSLVVNLFIVWIVFLKSNFIYRVMGEGGSKAFAKVASLLLAAIAVMMIRRGFMDIMLYIKKSAS
ncbi:MAG TPA: MarC family protein [Candidatus Wujingus californicus]|uniref:MarC family protein n=1 Tax=Candidatus Wujingus californicus TaxID=3367618 RepID=UPI001DD53BBD|nr:MarC family protein [Planctomycetota bacterium]MDO8131617.1 MarC family protein [Candidatus Brocadiales bacterium]